MVRDRSRKPSPIQLPLAVCRNVNIMVYATPPTARFDERSSPHEQRSPNGAPSPGPYADPMGRVEVRRPVLRISAAGERKRLDALAAEEPLEIRVDGTPLAVTMRTPGHDVELAHGFLLTEGVIGTRADIHTARYCDSVDEDGRNTYNVLDLTLSEGVPLPDVGLERNFY